MNIALVSQYFWPESFIINDLVKELTEQGHSVFVLTGKPNYPSGSIFSGYTQHSCMTEEYIPGVEVFRAPLRPRGMKGAKSLFLNYFSFAYNGIKFFPKAVKGKPLDVILFYGPSPITSAIPAIFLKWKTKAHLALWVQDLWPESLKATGYLTSSLLLKMVEWIVRGIYFCSDTLLVQSKSFIPKVSRLAKKNKIIYYPNSFPLNANEPLTTTPLPQELLTLLENYSCFVFAGNLGTAQALDTLLDAAKGLSHLENFRLVLVGSGSQSEHIERRIKEEGITHAVLAGRYPMEVMPVIFKRAAALIASLTNEEIFSYTIPSKIQAYLAASRPIIAALNGEGAEVINDAGAGFTCAAEDASGLMHCIEKIYHMSEEQRNEMGLSGHAYFMQHFEMSAQTKKLVELLNQRLSKKIYAEQLVKNSECE